MIVIWMAVAPSPVGVLRFHFEFEEWVVLPVLLAEVYTIGMIFVVVPIVVILVIARRRRAYRHSGIPPDGRCLAGRPRKLWPMGPQGPP